LEQIIFTASHTCLGKKRPLKDQAFERCVFELTHIVPMQD